MPITPQPGYMVDPNNPNSVVSISSYNDQQQANKDLAKRGYNPDGTPISNSQSEGLGNTPMRNSQQTENTSGYDTPPGEAPVGSVGGNGGGVGGGLSAPTRLAGESASAYATRILNSPFYLAGGKGATDANGNLSAFVFDSASNSYVAKPASSINRPITTAPKQNTISTDTVSTSGGSSAGSDALLGSETDAQKNASAYLDKFTPPETEAQIKARKTAEAGDRIQASKDYYTSLLTNQSKVNEQNSRETNARAVLNGLSGSSEAGTMVSDTNQKNTQANAKILAQQNVELQGIYKEIQDSAHNESLQQINDATASAKDILARKDAYQTKAVTQITTLAKSGFDFDSIKANDPVTYLHLAQAVGGEAQLKAIAVLNRPQETIEDKKLENGAYTIIYRNPLTGKTRIETTNLGLPPQYTKTIDAGDRILAVPDNWNGTVVQKGQPVQDGQGIAIPKGIAPKAPSTTTTQPKGTIISGGLTYTPQDAQEDTQALESSRGEDNFVDPSIYQQLYQAWVNHGGILKDFIAKYPPKLYVNPANTFLPSFLMPPKPAGSNNTRKA